mmetsp:Transcript_13993/g.33066  ORF Transcript_13993/g.33066 Transcript_13993/m.33066 type:complete len:360 (+) Transcript_13993:157-1236(+)
MKKQHWSLYSMLVTKAENTTWRLLFCLYLLFLFLNRICAGDTTRGEPRDVDCSFGQAEGYWSGLSYHLFNETCTLQRHVDALYEQVRDGTDSKLKGSVLFVGDTIDRNLINWIGEQFSSTVDDLTPFREFETSSGAPASTSLNRQVWVGDLHFANLYIFGVGEPPYPERATQTWIKELHNHTVERLCVDAPHYLPVAPDIIVVNSAYWDAVKLCYSSTYAWRRKHDKKVNQPHCWKDTNIKWENFVLEYMQDVYRLLLAAKTCYPSAKAVLWRTAPEVAVDDRSPWWHVIPPYVTSYLNNAARYAATKNSFELIQMDVMAAGRANDINWTPNGLHQSTSFNREYLNVVLNILTEAFRRT